MWILYILIAVLFIGSFIFFGVKLMGYKTNEQDFSEENLLEELKDISRIKFSIVPGGELYKYILGGCLMFLAYYVAICTIGIIIGNSWFLQGAIESAMFLPFYAVCFFTYFRPYAFFRKAIAPNLKYGELILKKLRKLIITTFIAVTVPVWISASVRIMHDEGQAFGSMIIGFFVGFFLFLAIPRIAIYLELQRLGLPNLLEGIKNLMKHRQHGGAK